MKIKICAIACFMGMAVTITSCTTKNMEKDYAAYVNPFIGTGGHGHTFPGPVVPNGMIQPSPDTRIDGWDASSGYYYEDSTINGFSHTHVSGTGCADYGDILLMPTVGKQTYDPQDYSSQTLPYASEFSHKNETAEPGYYSVFLDRYKVKAELTATKRAALHRYSFPVSNEAGFILDMDYSIQHQKNMDMQMKNVKKAAKLGANIGLGSDAGAYLVPHGTGTRDEYQYLRSAGVVDDVLEKTEMQVRDLFKYAF